MAQGAVAPELTNGIKKLTTEELHEILECEKIVRFRDTVLAGTHPRIHVPTHLKPRQTASPVQLANQHPNAAGVTNSIVAKAVEDNDTSNGRANAQWSSPGRSALSKAPQSEINPILLEKSDDLIKAEIQLRRQRLERALRDQIEQRRISLKASLQTSESLPDFDISEVLSKALSLASADAEAEQHVGTRTSDAGDSFDENTFYSSQHDTPGLSSPSQGREAGEAEVQQMTTSQSFETISSRRHDESHDLAMTDIPIGSESGPSTSALLHQPSLQHLTSKMSHIPGIPGLGSGSVEYARQDQSDSLYEKGGPTSSSSSSQMVPDANPMVESNVFNRILSKAPQDLTDLAGVQTGELLKRKFGEMADSTDSNESTEQAMIQARNDLSPFAPQPARISPLATARGPPIIDQIMIIDEPPPAQVTALRKESIVSTPDSSPKGTKPDKKKKKKKTRKSTGKDSATVDTPKSPYIKPEPRSPSPLTAAPLPRQRPNKRQRQAFNPPAQELNYDEPRYDSPREEQPQRETTRYREPELRPSYDRSEEVRTYDPRQADTYRRIRDDPQYRRVVSHETYRPPRSPDAYSMPYLAEEARTMRAAPLAVADSVELPRQYRDSNIPTGAVRIDLDRERSQSPILRARRSPPHMAPPPRMAPVRIVVDEYGREYYEPYSPVVARQLVAPHSRVGEEIVYERSLPRQSVAPLSRTGGEDTLYTRPHPRQSDALPTRDSGDDIAYERLPQRQLVAPVAQSTQSTVEDIVHERPAPRQSIAPQSRPVGEDIIYDRPPPRLVNRPVAELYEEGGVMYRRASPVYASARRVVTQPELNTEYRPYRQREYSVRPVDMAPPSEGYVRVHEAPLRQMSHFEDPRSRVGSVRPEGVRYETRRIEEVHHEYLPRVGSVRPESVRYEIPREYASRIQSVRPEPLREYAASTRPEQRIREYSMRPEPRKEMLMDQQGAQEFSIRPGEGETVRKEYIPTPESGYTATRPMGRRVEEVGEYRNRPREVPQDMYDEGARRDVVYM